MSLDQAITLWFHYEEIAMHFNELIIQYRLQLMGGVGVVGALSGYLIGSHVDQPVMRAKLRAWISTGVFIIVIAAAYLDVFYYNELLRGAVKALVELEAKHPEINLSTTIKNQFPEGATQRIIMVYVFFILPIIAFVIWSWLVVYKRTQTKRSS